jgi:L-ascorbate metabolism protein UlaG (beta-lactamase superfamily)
MNADEAAELTAVLKPELAIPHHYAFTSGWLATASSPAATATPSHYQQAAKQFAPETTVRIVEPGVQVEF